MKNILGSALFVSAVCVSFGFAARAIFYEVSPLLSDGAVVAPHVNPNLRNPWGLASSPTGPFWIANEGTGTSSIVRADGSLVAPDVAVPADHTGHPTGIVFYGGNGFVVHQGSASAPSRFLFVTLEGRVLGWSPQVDSAAAIVAVDNGPSGAVYTGAALGTRAGQRMLFAANFAAGRIDVFNNAFASAGSFTDATVPPGYAPFGIAEINGHIFATFVPRDPVTGDEVPGHGHGLIDVFATNGTLLERFATGGELDAPWAIVHAPGGFGPFSSKILVGNFGDGRILAYVQNGNFAGQLRDEDGDPIVIEGLWGLLFGNGEGGGDSHDLYFTAGIADETHGLFGEVEFEH
jgi:uncharacterized protein (TIGR03118 family)